MRQVIHFAGVRPFGEAHTAIFLVPSEIARDVSSVARVMAVWIVGGIVVLFGTFCYAELGAAMPQAGGDYIYLSRGLGPIWGFLFGWAKSLIMDPAASATIAAGLLRFVGFLLPSFTAPIFTLHVSLPFQIQASRFTFTAAQPWAAVVIAAVTAINYLGVRTAGRTQIVLTSLKVAALLAIVLMGVTLGRASGVQPSGVVTPPAPGGVGAFLMALVAVMWAYHGFAGLGSVGGEIVNPQRTIPRAAILGVLSVISLYLLVNLVYFNLLGFSQVAQSQHVASDVVVRLAGKSGAEWLTIAMIVSAFGALHSGFLTNPRVPFAMARDGQFFRFAKRVQPAFHTPSGALVFKGCVAAGLALTGTFEELFSLIIFATWMFYFLTAIALIRLRAKEPSLPRPYRAWGYPWTSLVFGVAALAMTANFWLVRPVRSSFGLAVIVLGIPFFRHWRKRAADTPLVEADL